jgi:hypothetical protein
MDERKQFVIRLRNGEGMASLCAESLDLAQDGLHDCCSCC